MTISAYHIEEIKKKLTFFLFVKECFYINTHASKYQDVKPVTSIFVKTYIGFFTPSKR